MERWKILLVDDEVDFASTLAERLRLRGLSVETAYEGEQALVMIERDLPQLVVLDIMMPGLGGMEVLQRVRTDHPDLPVVLLTGHGSTRDGIEGMRLGAFDYLMKPIKIEELVKKIEEALAGS